MLRRLCAITVQCTLLAMTVAGSGNPCGAQEDHASHMATANMEMPGAPMDMQTDADGTPADSHSGCPLPVSLAGCDVMASCAPSAIVVDSRAPVLMAARTHGELASRAEHLRSVTRTPELPPPRA